MSFDLFAIQTFVIWTFGLSQVLIQLILLLLYFRPNYSIYLSFTFFIIRPVYHFTILLFGLFVIRHLSFGSLYSSFLSFDLFALLFVIPCFCHLVIRYFNPTHLNAFVIRSICYSNFFCHLNFYYLTFWLFTTSFI